MKSPKYILVVGGAGYIGAHMVRTLLDAKYKVVVFDNLSTGHRQFVPKTVPFILGDLRKIEDMRKAFKKYRFEAVMHFAASSIVSESVKDPLKYYDNNVTSAINLIKVMVEHNVKKFIFSSTAAVYGEPKRVPIKETDPTNPKNPYGRSKLMIENILEDVSKAHDFRYIALRYFNAAGAHPLGEIGELHDPETHLIPNILKVAKGEKKYLSLFGEDYPTKDGTCIRDYIHVLDLCTAHFLALKILQDVEKRKTFNLGSGRGYTVKEIIKTVEKVTGKKVPVRIADRRLGEPDQLIAKSTLAQRVLGWKPAFHLTEIVQTAAHFLIENE